MELGVSREVRCAQREDVALMGILNVTPDSFFDGGRHVDVAGADRASAIAHAERLAREGATIVDVGAESTRPGAQPIDAATQRARIGPVIREAARFTRVSIDTTDVDVAKWALDEGATILNSVSLRRAAAFGALASASGAELILMHSRGDMASMPGFSAYSEGGYGNDVVSAVAREWSTAAALALEAGIPRTALWFDPGIGFHKNARQSLELLSRLRAFESLGVKMVVGASRKSFIAAHSRSAPRAPAQAEAASVDEPLASAEDRLGGSIGVAIAAAMRGARLLRVHDVQATRQALDLFFAVSLASESHQGGRAHPASGEVSP